METDLRKVSSDVGHEGKDCNYHIVFNPPHNFIRFT
jgi:hypothetical protein